MAIVCSLKRALGDEIQGMFQEGAFCIFVQAFKDP